MDEIVELTTEQEWREAFPVLRELRSHLSQEECIALLREMAPCGYRLLALRHEGSIIALAGIAVLTDLYHGRHVFVYELVTTAPMRSRGYGQRLLQHVEELARREGCRMVVLTSGLQRLDAHRFYEDKMGYRRVSWEFRKTIGGD